MKDFSNKIKKKIFYLKKSFTSSMELPKRLIIEKAKWLNNADSPVMLMIDDLANAWHSRNGKEIWDFGGDWGGGLSHKNSIITFIKENLLNDFPEIKTTFFTVVGNTSHYTYHEPFSFSEPLDYSDESKAFFQKLSEDENVEIAYHGYNHGSPGEKTENFIQEWKGFKSIDEACEQIARGMEIFGNVFGQNPSGGKYGGWEYNDFSDDCVDRSGFLWWCRDWTPRDLTGKISEGYYEPQFFGKNMVVALPSTLHGFFWNKKQIDRLLEKRQVISIEEHIAPLRPDGLIQTPNIIDDMNELRNLFVYLRNKNVWYATGTDVARYFISYSFTTIYDIKPDRFKVKYSGRIADPLLTLIIDTRSLSNDANVSIKEIILPDGNNYSKFSYLDKKRRIIMVSIPIQNGCYILNA
jgi:hypothetical protein